MQNNDPIASTLGLAVYDPPTQLTEYETNSVDSNIENDYLTARKNIQDIINKGLLSFDELSQIARSSTHPRSYEVLGNFMNSLIAANKDLIDINQKYKEISSESNKKVTNNLVITSADLLKLMKGAREE